MEETIIFAGCSLTWGQSLWYEGNIEKDNHPRDGFFYANMVCDECYDYMVENRWSTQVSHHFLKKSLLLK